MEKIGQIVMKKGAQMATKKFLDKQLDNNRDRAPGGQWDPYFEYRPNKRGKMKKVKKQIPAYIPAHDAEILADVRKWAYRLNVKLSFMGMRFGYATLIGAIPEVGDAIDVLLALYVYQKCRKVDGGLDRKTKAKMKAWIATDALIGVVPFVGDILDATIRCNARNCRLLEEFLDAKYKPKALTEEEARITAERRRHDPNYRPPAPATHYEDFSDDEYHHNGPLRIGGRDRAPDGYRHNDHVADGYSQRNRQRTAQSTGYDDRRGERRRR